MAYEPPGPRAPRRRGARLALFGLVLVITLGHCYGLREDELRCEEAVAHLLDCCPGFDPQSVSCTYSTGCGTHLPELTIEESRCIDRTTCATILGSNICQRAAAKAGSTGPQVCP